MDKADIIRKYVYVEKYRCDAIYEETRERADNNINYFVRVYLFSRGPSSALFFGDFDSFF